MFVHRRYTVETVAEMQLRSRIESDAVRNIWNNPERCQRRQQCQQQQAQQSRATRQAPNVSLPAAAQHHQQFYCTLQYQPLILKTEYQRRPLQPPPAVLSAEVPEFFPKSSPITYPNSDQECSKAPCQMRYFPSLSERNYRGELLACNQPQQETVFPNTRVSMLPATETSVFRSHPEWIQRIVPPMQMQVTSATQSPAPICTSLQPIHEVAIAHRPFQMYERLLPCVQHHTSPTAIPVYQRPSELYQEPTSKRKSHGVDFNNLILLTKSSSKTRRGHAKAAAQQPLLLESTQRDPRAGQNMAQWLDKDCARRTKGVVTVNALVSELRSYEEKYEHSRAGTSWAATTDSPPRHRSCSEGARSKDGIFGKEASRCRLADAEERDRRTKRPLYRDVLANATSGQHGIVLENVFERRYDELEQQAMEQYRNSEESLALKYQELERQAMEQYRNSNAADERQVDSGSVSREEQDCSDGRRCSGHGQCSPSKGNGEEKSTCLTIPQSVDSSSKKLKDSCLPQPQITLLRPKGKSLPNVFQGSSSSDSNRQTAVASRSLSTLTEGSLKESKNISKGASGDKIDTISVRTSSKRRLILVSPFERKSEARLMKTTELREICSLSRARKNVLDYYRSSEVAQNGSGDENITIIESPSTEGTMGRCR